MQQKQEIIIQYYREGVSQREIAKKTGLHRRTVNKYINTYQAARNKLLQTEGNERITEMDLIAKIVEPPTYTVNQWPKRILSEEIVGY